MFGILIGDPKQSMALDGSIVQAGSGNGDLPLLQRFRERTWRAPEEPGGDDRKQYHVDNKNRGKLNKNTCWVVTHYDLAPEDVRDAMYHVLKAFDEAGNGETDKEIEQRFFEYLGEQKISEMPEGQKVLMLQYIGGIFYRNYDYEMVEIGKKAFTGEIPLSEFIKSAAHYIETGDEMPVGVCRQINTRIATIGHDVFGMDTFAANVMDVQPHCIAGFKSEADGNIVFVNYSEVIDTGTPDFEEALAVYERMRGKIMASGSCVADKEGKPLTTIQSRAGRDVYEAGQIRDPSETVERSLEGEELIRERHLDMKITSEEQQIKLDNDKLTIVYTHFDRTSDPCNSLAQLHSLSLGRCWSGKGKALSVGTTILGKQIKDLETGVVNDPEVLFRIGGQYDSRRDLSRNWHLGFAAASEAVAIFSLRSGVDTDDLDDEVASFLQSFSSIAARSSYGTRLNYDVPQKPLQFFISAKQNIEFSPRNIQGFIDTIGPRVTSTELKAGSKVDIARRIEVDITGEYNKADYGRVIGIKAEVKAGGLRVSGEYSKTKSDLFFIPHRGYGRLAITREDVLLFDKAKVALTIYYDTFDRTDCDVAWNGSEEEFGVRAMIAF